MHTLYAFLYLSCTGSLVVLRLPSFLGEQKQEPFGHYRPSPPPQPPKENPYGVKNVSFFRGTVTTEFKEWSKTFYYLNNNKFAFFLNKKLFFPRGRDLNSEQLGNPWETIIVLTLLVKSHFTVEWKDPKRKTPLNTF